MTGPGVIAHARPVLPAPVGPPPLAGWWRRVAGALLDDALLGAVTWLAAGPGVEALSLHPGFSLAPADAVTGGTGSVVWPLGVLAVLVLLLAYTGATPGKRVAGVAVVRADTGVPAGLGRSVARPVLHLLDALLLIGYLRPLWHARRQTFADSLLGTVVVQTRGPLRHPALVRFARPDPVGPVVVTVAASVVCAFGVAFSLGTAGGGQVLTGDPRPCEVQGAPGAAGVSATVQPVTYTTSERRGWVRRPTPDAGTGIEVTWTWPDRIGVGAVTTDVWVSRSGTGRGDASLVSGGAVAEAGGAGSAVSALEPGLVGDVGADGWVESDLRVAGDVVATCRVPGPVP
ncbi:RDD family protein [Cellulomonas triticagri]|uniref:RDD family protein n=1 Tax=Cellulomonas triticagri TaxID=2483352 RepID=UPI0013152498|nr:RDD family protein [Cellulomonas triticagri]